MGFTDGAVTVGPYEDYSNGRGDPFAIASAYLVGADGIQNFVEEQIEYAQGIANESTTIAYDTIAALENSQLVVPDSLGPPLPVLDFNFNYDMIDLEPDLPDFGFIPEYNIGPAPVYTGDRTVSSFTIPSFDPSFTTLYIPPAPAWVNPTPLGAVPEVTDPAFPPAPTFTDPLLPTLSAIVLPPQPTVTIPELDIDFPEFTALPPSAVIEWTEPTYTPEIIDQAISQIETFLAGGTGIRPDVEEAMFARAGEREDRIAKQAVDEVIDEYATRGFAIPPGMLQKRIDSIRFERDLKKQGISREILIKSMDVEIENLRFAVTQGIAAEELFVRLFLAATERAFTVARTAVEFAIRLYELQIEIFKAYQEEVRSRVIAFQAQVEGELARVELYKALIEGEMAKVQIDRAKVELYNAQIEGIKTYVEKYEVEVRAEVAKLQAAELRIRAFGEQVNVYNAELNANKIRFDGYDSQIRAELGKAQIVEAESRAYVGEVQGIAAGVSAEARALEASVAVFGSEVDAFRAEVQAERDKATSALASIQANVAGYEAATSRYVADSGRHEALARIELAAWAGGLQNQLEYYRTQIAKYETDIRTLAEQARIALGGLEAAGGMATTIIGGALAAMHVGATISGNGGVTASGNLSESYSTAKSINESTERGETILQSIEHSVNADAPDSIIAGSPPWGTGNV